MSKFQKYFVHILKTINIFFYNFIAVGNRSKFQNTLYSYAQYIKPDFFYKISYFIIAVGNHGDMLHYFPILSILKPTHIKYSYISFLMLLQYYLIEEIFKTLRKSIEREQKCKLIPFFLKCTHFDLFLHKKKHRWTFEYRKESVCKVVLKSKTF